jgi:hypothetical protein
MVEKEAVSMQCETAFKGSLHVPRRKGYLPERDGTEYGENFVCVGRRSSVLRVECSLYWFGPESILRSGRFDHGCCLVVGRHGKIVPASGGRLIRGMSHLDHLDG